MWLILILGLAAILYYISKKTYSYWPQRGVKQGNPVPFLGDNWGSLFNQHSMAPLVQRIYNISSTDRYVGFYQFMRPTLMIKDPELIKQITVKDFDHFVDHRTFISENADPLWGKNLFALTGKRWRDMRATLSPSFTSSKMRGMFVLMSEAAENFINYFDNKNGVIEIEMKDTFTRFTNDVIATTAFGIKVDSLKDRQNIFFTMGKEATSFQGFWKNMRFFGYMIFPAIYKIFKITLLGGAVNNFFLSLVRDTIKMREEKGIVRPDMIHLLMEARKGNSKVFEETEEVVDAGFATVKEELQVDKKIRMNITDLDIAAQALLFFFGGFDSVSALMCFTAHELAVNPEVQKKLRQEILETSKANDGKITYEALMGMKYLDMVICETLRKWPNGIAGDRICTKPYTIQPERPGEQPIHLVEGDNVWIPMYSLHRDPQYFPDPDRFDPERFSEENKSSINPYVYIPFGIGPRNCIGSRFALLETKAIFFHILSRYEIVPTAKTQIPLKLCKKTFTLAAEKGFWLGMKPIKS